MNLKVIERFLVNIFKDSFKASIFFSFIFFRCFLRTRNSRSFCSKNYFSYFCKRQTTLLVLLSKFFFIPFLSFKVFHWHNVHRSLFIFWEMIWEMINLFCARSKLLYRFNQTSQKWHLPNYLINIWQVLV